MYIYLIKYKWSHIHNHINKVLKKFLYIIYEKLNLKQHRYLKYLHKTGSNVDNYWKYATFILFSCLIWILNNNCISNLKNSIFCYSQPKWISYIIFVHSIVYLNFQKQFLYLTRSIKKRNFMLFFESCGNQ